MGIKHTATAALAFAICQASANDLMCAADPATDAYKCVRLSELREAGDVRHGPMYSGGPAQVRPTGYTVHIDCRTDVVKLKDRDGVTFGGGLANSTRQLYQLSTAVCTATLPTRRKR